MGVHHDTIDRDLGGNPPPTQTAANESNASSRQIGGNPPPAELTGEQAARLAQRQPIAERLYRQGFTMEAIARQLGVSQGTISGDLATLSETINVEERGMDTRGRKKSTGRPKGSTKAIVDGRA